MNSFLIVFSLAALAAPSNKGFDPNSNWHKRFATYIAANPKASLSVAVSEANKILEQEGLPSHVFFKSNAVWNIAKNPNWNYVPPKKLNPCDQRIGVISAVQSQAKAIQLANKNRNLKVDLPVGAHLSRVDMIQKDSKDPAVTFYSPVISPPMGVSEDGQQIYFRYQLNSPSKTTTAWFQNAVKESQELLEETPFLVLAVDRNGQFRFLDVLEAYEEQEAEADDFDEASNDPNSATRAFEFKPYGWVLRFEETCEQEDVD